MHENVRTLALTLTVVMAASTAAAAGSPPPVLTAEETKWGKASVEKLASKRDTWSDEDRQVHQALTEDPSFFALWARGVTDPKSTEKKLVIMEACRTRGFWKTLRWMGYQVDRKYQKTTAWAHTMAEASYRLGEVDSACNYITQALWDYPYQRGLWELLHRIEAPAAKARVIDDRDLFRRVAEHHFCMHCASRLHETWSSFALGLAPGSPLPTFTSATTEAMIKMLTEKGFLDSYSELPLGTCRYTHIKTKDGNHLYRCDIHGTRLHAAEGYDVPSLDEVLPSPPLADQLLAEGSPVERAAVAIRLLETADAVTPAQAKAIENLLVWDAVQNWLKKTILVRLTYFLVRADWPSPVLSAIADGLFARTDLPGSIENLALAVRVNLPGSVPPVPAERFAKLLSGRNTNVFDWNTGTKFRVSWPKYAILTTYREHPESLEPAIQKALAESTFGNEDNRRSVEYLRDVDLTKLGR